MTDDSSTPPSDPQGPTAVAWHWPVHSGPIQPISILLNGKPFDAFGHQPSGRQARSKRGKDSRPADGYLTRREAANYLGVSLRWLESNVSIPKTSVASPGAKRASWRYRRADLDGWMLVHRKTGRTD